jgi:hypothetical protein
MRDAIHAGLPEAHFIGDAGEQSFERRGQTRGHRILCGPSFQSGEHGMEAEACAGSDSQLANLEWNISEAGLQYFKAAIPGAGISGTEFCIPEEG